MIPLQYIGGGWPRIFSVVGVGFLVIEAFAIMLSPVTEWPWRPTELLDDDMSFGAAVVATFGAFMVGEVWYAMGRQLHSSKWLLRFSTGISFDEIVVGSDNSSVGEQTRVVIRQALNLVELFSALFFLSLIASIPAIKHGFFDGGWTPFILLVFSCVVFGGIAKANLARAELLLLLSEIPILERAMARSGSIVPPQESNKG